MEAEARDEPLRENRPERRFEPVLGRLTRLTRAREIAAVQQEMLLAELGPER